MELTKVWTLTYEGSEYTLFTLAVHGQAVQYKWAGKDALGMLWVTDLDLATALWSQYMGDR